MLTSRRRFLLASVTSPYWAPGLVGCGAPGAEAGELWISAQGRESKSFGMGWTTPGGRADQLAVGFRGHDVVPHPRKRDRALLVGRRPGHELVEMDLRAQRIERRVACEAERVLCGHACFSADGQVLFTTESDTKRGEGRIVVRDADDYRVLSEFSSHGVGPHELLLMPDGHTLAIANGGLLEDEDGAIVNLDSMVSTLSFVDVRDGSLLHAHGVEEPKASIRHIALGDGGEVSVALQMQREAAGHERLAPLAAVYDEAAGLSVLSAPESVLLRCEDYVGSTRINSRSRVAGFTSPRGDIALFWDLDSRELVATHTLFDVCGLTVSLDEDVFVLSNSAGELRCLDAFSLEEQTERRLELSGFAWDNHLRTLALGA